MAPFCLHFTQGLGLWFSWFIGFQLNLVFILLVGPWSPLNSMLQPRLLYFMYSSFASRSRQETKDIQAGCIKSRNFGVPWQRRLGFPSNCLFVKRCLIQDLCAAAGSLGFQIWNVAHLSRRGFNFQSFQSVSGFCANHRPLSPWLRQEAASASCL